jgi:hypothetical protein
MGLETAFYVAVVAGAVSAQQQHKAAKAQNKAAERAGNLEKARALSEQNSRNRRAVAQRRQQVAELIAQSQVQNAGGNSAVSGAVGALGSDTASNIGSNQINLAANIGQSTLLQKGQNQALRFNRNAAIAGTISSAASAYGSYLGAGGGGTTAGSGTTKTS